MGITNRKFAIKKITAHPHRLAWLAFGATHTNADSRHPVAAIGGVVSTCTSAENSSRRSMNRRRGHRVGHKSKFDWVGALCDDRIQPCSSLCNQPITVEIASSPPSAVVSSRTPNSRGESCEGQEHRKHRACIGDGPVEDRTSAWDSPLLVGSWLQDVRANRRNRNNVATMPHLQSGVLATFSGARATPASGTGMTPLATAAISHMCDAARR